MSLRFVELVATIVGVVALLGCASSQVTAQSPPTPVPPEAAAPTQPASTTPAPAESKPAAAPVTPVGELVKVAPSSYRLDVPPLFIKGELCFAGSLAMLAKHNDSSILPEDIIGYGGLGPRGSYLPAKPSGIRYVLTGGSTALETMAFAARHLGFGITAGVARDGRLDATVGARSGQRSLSTPFTDSAKQITYFNNKDEAFDLLRRAVASGYPVEVHLNTVKIMNGLAALSEDWRAKAKVYASMPNKSEFVVVTGYDSTRVYLNDPTAQSTPANLSATIEDFLAAWNVPEDMDQANVGPYWMMFLKKAGARTSAKDVITWNGQTWVSTPQELRAWAKTVYGKIEDPFPSQTDSLSAARSLYSEFLEKNGSHEAASLYSQSAGLWASIVGSNNPAADANKIADLEEQAAQRH